MPTIVKKLRQTVIDHDPAVENSFDGAIRIYQQWVLDDDGTKIGQMEDVAEVVKGDDLVSILGETSAKHVLQLDQTEEILAAEREGWKTREASYVEDNTNLSNQVEDLRKEGLSQAAKIAAARNALTS